MPTQKPTMKPSTKPSTMPSSKPEPGHDDDLLDDLNNLTIRPATTQVPSSTKKPENPPSPHGASRKPSSRPSPSQVPLPKTYAPQSFAPTIRPETKVTGPSKAPRLSVINELPSSRPSSSPHGQTQYAQATTLQRDKAQSRAPTQISHAQATSLQRDKTQMPMNTTLYRDPTQRPPTGYPSQSTLSQASSMERNAGMSQGGHSIMQSIMQSRAPPESKTFLISQRDLEMARRQTKITTMNPDEAKQQHEWAQQMIDRVGICPEGYKWDRRENPGGYQCRGQAHGITDDMLQEGKGGLIAFDPEHDWYDPNCWAGPYYPCGVDEQGRPQFKLAPGGRPSKKKK